MYRQRHLYQYLQIKRLLKIPGAIVKLFAFCKIPSCLGPKNNLKTTVTTGLKINLLRKLYNFCVAQVPD